MKKRVATHFNRAGETYAQAADVQAEVARACAGLLPKAHSPLAVEIGAGGGVFTNALRARQTWDRYIGLDIAHGMLRPLARHASELLVAADAEAAPLNEGIADLVVSASTMQWFENPRRSVPACLRLLRPGGRFALAVFVRGTLAELGRVSNETGFGTIRPLLPADDYQDILCAMPDVRFGFQTMRMVRTYPSVREFLRRLQHTGATCTERKRPFSRQAWQAFESRYAERYGDGTCVRSTYRVLYLWGERL
jgi:malonyl-CoA O-methyltransferase